MIKQDVAKKKQRAERVKLLAAKLASAATRMNRYAKMEGWTDAQDARFSEIERDYQKTLREINSLTVV